MEAQDELWKLWFKALIDRTGEAVAEFLETYRGEVPEFQERVDDLLNRCRGLARYRNKIVHLFGGDPVDITVLFSDVHRVASYRLTMAAVLR
jgi:hypothetical protein